LGDFDFDAANFLTPAENHLYWAIWLMIVLLTCIVFLNFIIAEASASYEVVKKSLEAMIYKEKTSLVTEAELMYFKSWKNKSNFPKYIIIR
jgi:multisubunit Na+/H+ antiporter MnhE subunit